MLTAMALSQALARLDLETHNRIGVAVSGGSDSLATLLALQNYVLAHAPHCALFAYTVDHRLRAESTAEAHYVGSVCADLGIAHRVANWRPGRLTSGVQRKAREARYRLLYDAARADAVSYIVTGHTRDDCRETYQMHLDRAKDANRGLASIASATLYSGSLWFVRPMLGLSRQTLRASLVASGFRWVDDPSNQDARFERVRVRRGALSPGIDVQINRARQKRNAMAKGAAKQIAGSDFVPEIAADGRYCLVAAKSLAVENDADGYGREALGVLLSMVGSKPHRPTSGAIAKAVEFCTGSARSGAFTIHGCTMTRVGNRIEIKREPRNCGAGQFGFDHLLPIFDLPLAQALRLRRGLPQLPTLPLIGDSH